MTAGGPAPTFGELFAALPTAILVLDPGGRIVRVSAACEALLNLSERSMLGQRIDAVMAIPTRANDEVDRAFAAFDVDVNLVRGGVIRVDYLHGQIADHPGWRTVILHDDAASRRLGLAKDRAAAARSAIGAAAMLAHEIKNPLSGIRGAAQLLSGGGSTSDELTTLIMTEVDRIAALIDGMQGFTDTRPLKPESVNIYPLINHARRLAKVGFGQDIQIEERFDPSLPHVIVDCDALLQVLINLLKNACEAVVGMPNPKIVVTTAFRHGMAVSPGPDLPRQPLPIEVCVLDNGPGAPDDLSEHLFEPFVTTKREGHGLGLALADKLVRDMGGVVQYAREGSPAQTVFRLLLPRGVT